MNPRTLLAFIACSFACASSHALDPSISSLLRPQLSEDGKTEFEAMLSRGYKPLFNGQDLSGWRNPYPHGEAEVVDGEIHLKGNNKFFLVTDKTYSDFRISVEIHLPEGPANSGVMFRCHVDPEKEKMVYGYQAECDGSERRWSGGLFDESRRGWIWPSTPGRSEPKFLKHEKESKAAFATPTIRDALNRNGWNRFEITCFQNQITIELNGVKTVQWKDTMDASGFIAIQHHGEKGQTYRFRNLFIKELPNIVATEAVEIIEQSPVHVTKIDKDFTLVDFGKVAYGNIAVTLPKSAPFQGTMHFGEKLSKGRIDRNPPGTVRYGKSEYTTEKAESDKFIIPAPVNVKNIEQTGNHPPAVLTPNEWMPVMPFRWVEVEGWPEELKPESIVRRAAFAKGFDDNASSFECSEPLLNRIWELCKYSIKATTFAGVYVDGDRERIPYEADAYLNQLSHYAVDDDVQMAARTFDWLIENSTWPTEWAPHMVLMAHAEWIDKADGKWLSQRYESLKMKTLLDRSGPDGLVRSNQSQQQRDDIVDWPRGERDHYVFTEINTVVNAFHIEAMKKMAVMARAVGKEKDAERFEGRVELATSAFQKNLFNESTGLFRDGVGTDHSSVHANFFPLAFGIVPVDKVDGIVDWLSKQPMRCSVYAAQYLLDALFTHGADQKAIDLILAPNDRSWKHMVESGTTITWEAWDLKYKPNQDWNHAWGAAPANLLPRYVLGVQPASPGWTRATIRPHVGNLSYARGKIPTPFGPITLDWRNESTFQLDVNLPPGIEADLEVPAPENSTRVLVNGKRVEASQRNDRWILNKAVTGNVQVNVE
ncbi:Bacterial alpha-L-rhamnosidase [Novipirellula aureliae]|uniref:alpha-L-rhamnosidase n=1 Tax=Novipirellula aureliae TaxID=2527966 RepID=A0A5C6E5A3_9BACT|nr:family 78 glycoside hydrolase catalytic domain [Novipirellula aureliae]TWU43127.1 Bacterial alpha-L-rhamnosidase [Novipirellula aureliae]